MAMPTWIREVQAISTAAVPLGAIAIGVFGYRLSQHQADTARRKLKLDLFERRFAIYRAVTQAIIVTLNNTHGTFYDETMGDLDVRVEESRFLFPADIFEHFNNIKMQVITLRNGNDLNAINQSYVENKKNLEGSYRELPKKLEQSMKVDEKSTFSSWRNETIPTT